MFNPGITNTDQRQVEMANELERSSTDVLVLDTRFLPIPGETASGSRPGSTVLNDYIARTFEIGCTIGPIVLMQRRGQDLLACP
jgi:hypothetical protein